MKRKIIVLTPVKNEAWIIEQFLKITSAFADHIIIADQQSSDKSISICEKFQKVTVVKNDSADYREDDRQNLLINKARALFPGENVLLALDADEIATASSLHPSNWEILRNAPVGSVFYFEKPDLFPDLARCIRHRQSFYPMGFVDDGNITHEPKKVHSIRVPIKSNSARIDVEDITFLHYSYVRPQVQREKFRFYSLQEAVLGTAPWYRRRRRYRKPNHLLPLIKAESIVFNWLNYPDSLRWNVDNFEDCTNSWFNIAAAEMVAKHGEHRFWLDDIWDEDFPVSKRHFPPKFLQYFARLTDMFNK